jgi:uncharacterized membrane-anchored protein
LNIDVIIVLKASVDNSLPKSGEKDVELKNYRVDEESISKGRPSVVFQEGHEEAKTDQHHHIDVLVGWVSVGVGIPRRFVLLESHEHSIKNGNKDFHH